MNLFDFNDDGVQDAGEEWIEYQIMNDCMKDFDQYQANSGPKRSGTPSRNTPSCRKVGCGCAIQLLGAIICLGTVSTIGTAAVIICIGLVIVGGLVGRADT